MRLTDYVGTPTLALDRGVNWIANRHDRRVMLLAGGFSRLLADDDLPVLLSIGVPFGIQGPISIFSGRASGCE